MNDSNYVDDSYVEEEEQEFLTDPLEDDSDFLDEEEEKPLNKSKVLGLIGIGFSAFLIFFIFLFPLEEVIKSYLVDLSKTTGIVIEFKDIRFPLIGAKTIDSLAIQPTSDTILKVEEAILDLKTWELIQNRFDGDIDLIPLKLDSGEIGFMLKSVLISGRLSGIEERLTKTTGDIKIQIRGGKISSLPEIPMVGEAKDIVIIKGQFHLKFRSGRLHIELGSLDTSWFKFQLSGVIRLADSLAFSNLDLKLCATSQEKFANERPDLAGMLAILPQEGGRSCIPIKGTIHSPSFDIPAFTAPMPSEGESINLDSPDSPVIRDGESTVVPEE